MLKPKRLRFSSFDDVVLLRQVVSINPVENGWKEVQDAVVRTTGKNFNVRSLREHTQHLLKLHSKEDYSNLRKSGTEREYAEKEKLLQELKDMMRDLMPKNGKCEGDQNSSMAGMETKEQPCIIISREYVEASPETSEVLGVVENNEDSMLSSCRDSTSRQSGVNLSTTGPSRLCSSRKPQGNHPLFSLLKEKQNREAEHERELLSLKKRKLQLELEKLQLEREKFEIERKEREARLEMERIEQDHRIAREKKQLEIIGDLIKINKDRL